MPATAQKNDEEKKIEEENIEFGQAQAQQPEVPPVAETGQPKQENQGPTEDFAVDLVMENNND